MTPEGYEDLIKRLKILSKAQTSFLKVKTIYKSTILFDFISLINIK